MPTTIHTDLALQFDQLAASLNQANDRIVGLQVNFDNFLDAWADQITQIDDEVEEVFHQGTDQLETIAEAAMSTLSERFENLDDILVEQKEELVEELTEECESTVTELLEKSKELLTDEIDSKVAKFTDAGKLLDDTLEETLDTVREFVSSDVTEAIKDEGDKTLRLALERASEEVAEGTVTSLAQVQITGVLAPIIPALMVARVVAAIIRKLLEILRMFG